MRKRDRLFAGLAAIGFLTLLAWALSTQSDWVQRASHADAPPANPAPAGDGANSAHSGTRVIGTVDDDTRKALDKHFQDEREARKRKKPPSPEAAVP
ncbi:MAG TPA: hypothetical protein VNV60_09050 [Holophagaceae bacterium]|jgi:hypothetical protein|nr:hypothetical protein [Holophagaceae bacterium]